MPQVARLEAGGCTPARSLALAGDLTHSTSGFRISSKEASFTRGKSPTRRLPSLRKIEWTYFVKNKRLDYLLLSPGQAVPSASRKTLESPADEPAATRKARPGLLETRNHFISRDHLSTWPPTTAASSGFWKHQLEFHRLCNLRFFLGCVRQFPLPTSRPTSPECLPFRLRFIFPTKTDFHRKLKQRQHLQTTKRKEK